MAATIADKASRFLPETWDKLKSSSLYGNTGLTDTVTTVKDRVLGSNAPASSAEDTLPLIVQDYIAKLVALEVIPAGIDLWGRQIKSQTLETSGDTMSYGDPIAGLEKTRDYLVLETRRMRPEVEAVITTAVRIKVPGPAVSDAGKDFVSVDPNDAPGLFGRPLTSVYSTPWQLPSTRGF